MWLCLFLSCYVRSWTVFLSAMPWKVKVSLVRHKGVWGNEGIAPPILNLDDRRKWVVNITPRHLYPLRKEILIPLNKKLGRSHSHLGPLEKIKVCHPCRKSNPDSLIASLYVSQVLPLLGQMGAAVPCLTQAWPMWPWQYVPNCYEVVSKFKSRDDMYRLSALSKVSQYVAITQCYVGIYEHLAGVGPECLRIGLWLSEHGPSFWSLNATCLLRCGVDRCSRQTLMVSPLLVYFFLHSFFFFILVIFLFFPYSPSDFQVSMAIHSC